MNGHMKSAVLLGNFSFYAEVYQISCIYIFAGQSVIQYLHHSIEDTNVKYLEIISFAIVCPQFRKSPGF